MSNQNRLPILDTVDDLKSLSWKRYNQLDLLNQGGVYCIYDTEQEVVIYAGTSKNIGYRLYEHKYSGKYDKSKHELWAIIENDETIRLLIESKVISLWRPTQNQRNQVIYLKKITNEEAEEELERAYRRMFG